MIIRFASHLLKVAGILFLSLLRLTAIAQSIDSSFGVNGFVYVERYDTNWALGDMIVRQDDKILEAGVNNMSFGFSFVMRYNENGSIDSSFNKTGFYFFQPDTLIFPSCVLSQPDKKVDLIGQTVHRNVAVMRLTDNGTIDAGFGRDGIVKSNDSNYVYSSYPYNFDALHAAALQVNGDIVAVGRTSVDNGSDNKNIIMILRFTSNGKVDSTFGTDGFVHPIIYGQDEQAESVMIQPDQKIVVTGYTVYPALDEIHFFAIRLNTNGTMDSEFGNNGIEDVVIHSFNSYPYTGLIQQDGKIVIAGTNANQYAVFRLDTSGALDSTFGVDGYSKVSVSSDQYLNICYKVLQMADNKLILIGNRSGSNVNTVARVNTNGSLDATFGMNGIAVYTLADSTKDTLELHDQIYKGALQSNDRILLAGTNYDLYNTNQMVLIRLKSDTFTGIQSPIVNSSSIQLFPNPSKDVIKIKSPQNNIKCIVSIYDILGHCIFHEVCANLNDLSIDTKSLARGTYFITFNLSGQIISRKFIVL